MEQETQNMGRGDSSSLQDDPEYQSMIDRHYDLVSSRRSLSSRRRELAKEVIIEVEEEVLPVITKADVQEFILDPNSIEAKIKYILENENNGLHLKEIIFKLEQIGWHSNSEYHKYSSAHKLLTKYSYMVEKCGKAKFRIRDGMKYVQQPKPVYQPKIKVDDNKLCSTSKAVFDVVSRFSNEAGITCKELTYIMHQLGYHCSERAIEYNLENKKHYRRRKNFYYLKKYFK
jgi:hypothetical protein